MRFKCDPQIVYLLCYLQRLWTRFVIINEDLLMHIHLWTYSFKLGSCILQNKIFSMLNQKTLATTTNHLFSLLFNLLNENWMEGVLFLPTLHTDYVSFGITKMFMFVTSFLTTLIFNSQLLYTFFLYKLEFTVFSPL